MIGKPLSEYNMVRRAIAPSADMWAGTVDSEWVRLAMIRRATLVIHEGAGSTGRTLIKIQAAADSTGAGATAIAFRYRIGTTLGDFGAWLTATAAGFTTAAGGDQIIQIEVTQQDLAAGQLWVRLNAVEAVDAATVGHADWILGGLRYSQHDPIPLDIEDFSVISDDITAAENVSATLATFRLKESASDAVTVAENVSAALV